MSDDRQMLEDLVEKYLSKTASTISTEELGWLLTKRASREGASILWHLDGERAERQLTIVATGGPLGKEPIRQDGHSLEEVLTSVFSTYAARCWD